MLEIFFHFSIRICHNALTIVFLRSLIANGKMHVLIWFVFFDAVENVKSHLFVKLTGGEEFSSQGGVTGIMSAPYRCAGFRRYLPHPTHFDTQVIGF
jgi:hypothetical protein